MKNSFIALLLAFPAMLAAQTTYNFSYDKSGNVTAIKPVIKTVINDNINIGKNADGSLSVQVSPNPTSGLIAVALNIAGSSSADISTMAWNTKLGAVTDALNLGYSVAGVIPGLVDMGHMVVIENVFMKTVEKLNGDIVQSLFYSVMDPARGFVDIPVKLLTGNIIVVF